MIAFDFEHGRAVEHALQRELLLWEVKGLKAAGDELHEHIAVILSDEIDDVEALQLAFDHQRVLLGFDHHIVVCDDLVAFAEKVEQVSEDFLHFLF